MWDSLPIDLIYIILVKYHGRFILRKNQLIYINKIEKNDIRYKQLSHIIPYPYQNDIEITHPIFGHNSIKLRTVVLKLSKNKKYILSQWFTEIIGGVLIPSTDVVLVTIINTNMKSIFLGTF
jgi:aromatic ring-opening dioxygenase LigB subunit